MLLVSASLAFIVQRAPGARIGTHTLAKHLRDSTELDKHLAPIWPALGDPAKAADCVLGMMSKEMQASANLQISKMTFLRSLNGHFSIEKSSRASDFCWAVR